MLMYHQIKSFFIRMCVSHKNVHNFVRFATRSDIGTFQELMGGNIQICKDRWEHTICVELNLKFLTVYV